MDFEGLLTTIDYATYINAVLGKEFVIAIAQHIESNQVEEMKKSLFFLYS